ncbi:hypothetical protein B0H14DRAFT_1457158 [Mycena olivaceomarginata]|nr:hypothetical protein B0H14DRAFT_1457158 [Mycena olivaceomarginata]
MGSGRAGSGCARASYCGVEAHARIDPRSWLVAIGLRLAPRSSLPRKTVVICLLSRGFRSMRERAPLAEGPLTLAYPHLDVMPPCQRPCSDIRSSGVLSAFSLSTPTPPSSHPCASATKPPHLRPPLRAPLIRRPPPHLLVATTVRPWSGAPHLQHIHHRRPPSVAASHTRLTAQPSRRKCVRESGSGRPGGRLQCVSAACSSREDERRARRAPHEARCRPRSSPSAMSSRRGEDDAGRGEAWRALVHVVVLFDFGGGGGEPEEDDKERGDALECPIFSLSSSAAAYLCRRMAGTSREGTNAMG